MHNPKIFRAPVTGDVPVSHLDIMQTLWQKFTTWASDHPKTAIAGMALFAVVLSSYPVVFFGKSFVSPNNGALLLYQTFPTLPGYKSVSLEDAKGSDVGAIMWAHLPYSVIQSRAISHDFELPLWNRYNSTGTTLLAQGQSMFGDPLHVIVLLAEGTSWAWDIKYLLVKILFAASMGLTVYAATHHLPSSLILAFSSAFIGFFSFRFNHPAFFSMCYAPWILYCWFRIVQSTTIQSSFLWMVGLLLANWTVMNSGTVKEAYMLLVSLNLCGALVLLLTDGDIRLKLKKCLHLIGGGVLFFLISSPIWLTFLDALKQSYTSYNVPTAYQTHPSLLIGLFDDIFYRQLIDRELLFNPSANFLILLGFLWSLTRITDLISSRAYLAVSLSALVSFSLVFGIVPASIIVKIPFLANVSHVNNTFSVVLIIHLIVLAGFGLKAFWVRFDHEKWRTDLMITILILGALLAFYFFYTQAAHKSTFFYGYGFSLISAFVALPFIIKRIMLYKVKTHITGLLLLGLLVGFAVLHWRHGMHLKTGFDNYVMNPQVRVNLQAKSNAIKFIKTQTLEPFRAVGFGEILIPGYSAVLGIESLSGPDALINPYYRELAELSAIERGWDWRYIIRQETFAELKHIYDFLNIKYYLAPQSNTPKKVPGLEFIGNFDLDVYRSNTAWPRAFYTDMLCSYEAPSELVGMVKGGDGHPFAAIQGGELARNPSLESLLGDQKQRHVVSATDYKLTNNTTSFTIIAPRKGVIVLTEAYMGKDFGVIVNGKPTSYFRVNHAFKGVQIDAPGRYTISFGYWPRYFTASVVASSTGLLLLIFWAVIIWKVKRNKSDTFHNSSVGLYYRTDS